MIRIGLTRFDNHETLTGKPKTALFEYAGYLPLVELDTAFYAIPRKTSVENWLTQVPGSFRFIIKAYQGLTKQRKDDPYFSSVEAMAEIFLEATEPLIREGKLFCFLFQFPSFFTCTKENVAYLQKLRGLMGDVPITVEFRNESWYEKKVLDSMRKFMETQSFSLGIIDEPQVQNRSVPFDRYVTNSDFAMFRFHGRNLSGWQEKGADWNRKRTLYRYNDAELKALKIEIELVARESKEVAVVFNNDSGGDAADNALQMMRMMKLDYEDLNPKQLDLF